MFMITVTVWSEALALLADFAAQTDRVALRVVNGVVAIYIF